MGFGINCNCAEMCWRVSSGILEYSGLDAFFRNGYL